MLYDEMRSDNTLTSLIYQDHKKSKREIISVLGNNGMGSDINTIKEDN